MCVSFVTALVSPIRKPERNIHRFLFCFVVRANSKHQLCFKRASFGSLIPKMTSHQRLIFRLIFLPCDLLMLLIGLVPPPCQSHPHSIGFIERKQCHDHQNLRYISLMSLHVDVNVAFRQHCDTLPCSRTRQHTPSERIHT